MSSERSCGSLEVEKRPQNEKPSTTDDMSSISASIVSHDHFAPSRASMELASLQGSQTDGDDTMETSTLGSSNTTSSFRKRKAATSMPLERKLVDDVVLPLGTRDPKDRWKDFAGMTTISFPLKLHRVLHEYELSYEETKQKRELEKKKKAKLDTDEESKSSKSSTASYSSNGNYRIMGWVHGGKSFQIFDEERFVDEIMPMYFSGTFREFQKDLRLWGFTSKPSVAGPPTRILHLCSHPLFIRSKPSLCQVMHIGGVLHSKNAPDHTTTKKRSPRWTENRERFGRTERMENE